MSLEGTVAGIAGAAGLGLVAIALGLVPRSCALDRRGGGDARRRCSKAGWARRSKRPGILNNDMLNFINTAAAALAAVAVASWLS